MNKLPQVAEGEWRLDRRARLIVYEAERGDELLIVYDCAAAQKPPSAQVRGNLVRVDAAHDLRRTPTGYLVDMREKAVLEEQAASHYVVRA